MTLSPLGNTILGRLMKEEQTTASGIVLPDAVEKSDLLMLDVLAVGARVEQIKDGDRILVKKVYVDEVKLDGLGGSSDRHFTVPEDDVTGIVTEEATE
jgi:chaperonin GroES